MEKRYLHYASSTQARRVGTYLYMNRKPVKNTLTQEKKWTERALDLQLSWTYNSRKPAKKMPTQGKKWTGQVLL